VDGCCGLSKFQGGRGSWVGRAKKNFAGGEEKNSAVGKTVRTWRPLLGRCYWISKANGVRLKGWGTKCTVWKNLKFIVRLTRAGGNEDTLKVPVARRMEKTTQQGGEKMYGGGRRILVNQTVKGVFIEKELESEAG